MNKRFSALKIFFAGFAILIVGRTAYLASGIDKRLSHLAQRQFKSGMSILPRRGLVFDRNGEGLAISLKVRSVFVRPEVLKKETTESDRRRITQSLSHILQIPIHTIKSKVNSEKSFVWIKRQLPNEMEQAIRELKLLEYGDGIGLAEETKRFYPNEQLAAHILGTVNIDGQGIEGLELFYENLLKGEKVRITSSRDAMGRRIFSDDEGLLAFKDGQSLVLTIDKLIQYETEKALTQAVHEHQAKAGIAIIAEAQTGEILALANYPTFNPNEPSHFLVDQRRNRAVTDAYEPGSTFKPFIVGLALERGKSPDTKIYCEKGHFVVGNRVISEAETHEKHEWLNFSEILQHSSNIGSAKLALEMGPQSLSLLMNKLEISKKTNIDLPGEASGSFNKKELSNEVRRANVGFGQGFTVTPIQMLTYYLSLANNGLLIQPRLVKAVLSEDPDSLQNGAVRYKLGAKLEPENQRKIFSDRTVQTLEKMLVSVVKQGTGKKAELEEWVVAGKTGTAQKADPETRRYSHDKYMSSFVGYSPVSSERGPKLVALVMIDEPKNKYYAADTAAPVFKEIMRTALLRQRFKPQLISAPEVVDVVDAKNRTAISAIRKEVDTIKVKPALETLKDSKKYLIDLRGKTVREVVQYLRTNPLDFEVDVQIHGQSGVLLEQIPGPETPLQPGSKLQLVFGQAP